MESTVQKNVTGSQTRAKQNPVFKIKPVQAVSLQIKETFTKTIRVKPSSRQEVKHPVKVASTLNVQPAYFYINTG